MLHRLPSRAVPWIVLVASIATLGGAYLFQYVGGLPPCPLCLEQRIPYWVAIVAALGAALAAREANIGLIPLVLLGLCALAFAVGGGIAAFHAGVEYGWWEGPAGCTGVGAMPETLESLESGLRSARVPRCDEVPWSLAGISLAGFNFLISLALLGASLIPIARYVRNRRGEP